MSLFQYSGKAGFGLFYGGRDYKSSGQSAFHVALQQELH
jgi:hypothetical protein